MQFFRERGNFLNNKFESDKGFRHEAFLKHPKAHNPMQQGVFFL